MVHPLISIVVPVYKVPEQYLRKCIDSCVGQTMRDIEIILVDDGSPDGCGKICDEYAAADDRIKVIHKENGGLVSARNAGFDAINGEWHMYIDGDDWIEPSTCENILCALNRYDNVDVVFWKCTVDFESRSFKGKWEWNCQDAEHLYTGDECKQLALNTLIYKSGIATAYCKLIRTSYAKKYGIRHDDSLRQGAEGLEFSLRSFYCAQRALFLNGYWYHYIFNPDSISKKSNERNTEYLTECLKVICKDIAAFDDEKGFKDALLQRTAYILLAIAMSTYFHPSNKESLWVRVKKYKSVINSFQLYKESVSRASTKGMDKQRKLAFWLIRMRLYFMLDIIGWLKQFLMKRGKYNY